MSEFRMFEQNKVELAGRLTGDPDLRYLPSGVALCKFSIAVSKRWKKADGERKESTAFWDVEVWAKTAEYIGEHLEKGRPVIVEGSLDQKTWDDKGTGAKRSKPFIKASRVILLDWPSKEAKAAGQTQAEEGDTPGDEDGPF